MVTAEVITRLRSISVTVLPFSNWNTRKQRMRSDGLTVGGTMPEFAHLLSAHTLDSGKC